jgi:outer membrane protein TolC
MHREEVLAIFKPPNFPDVLNVQRSLFVSEDALVQSTGTVSTNLVAVYKALGASNN